MLAAWRRQMRAVPNRQKPVTTAWSHENGAGVSVSRRTVSRTAAASDASET